MERKRVFSTEAEKSLDTYFKNNTIGKDIFVAKYLKPNKITNSTIEYSETVEECFKRICDEAFSVSCEKDNKSKKEIKNIIYNLLYDGIFRPGGSIIAGLNQKNKKISLMNCTTLVIPEDNLEAIFTTLYQAAKMAAYRQGLGVLFSNIRPKGSSVNNSAEITEGSVHWMKPFNDIGDMCGQRKRKPAILGAQVCYHPDIFEFIECKDNLSSFNNMNLSVHITDGFMEAVKNNKDWNLYFKTNEISISKTIKASELFNKIAHHAWKTGEPGVIFINHMRRWSIQEAFGYKIENVNACSEKPLPRFGVCLLGSINVQKIPHIYQDGKILSQDPQFHKFLQNIIYPIVRFLDNIAQYEIDNNYKSPLKEQLNVIKNLREIGLGVTNIHEWLFEQGLAYDSDEAIEVVNELFKWLTYYTWKATIQLAKERGPCEAYVKRKEKNSILETDYLKFIFKQFPDLKIDFYKYGIRNAALLSIAPTGSISQILPNIPLSSGIEPLMAPYYWRKTRATNDKQIYEYYFVIPSKIKDLLIKKLEELSKENESFKNDLEKIKFFPGSIRDDDGEIGKEYIKIIKKYLNLDILKSSHEIDPFQKIKLMSKVQKWVDAAISVTYNLPENFPEEEIKKLYLAAYEYKLKSMTVYRDGCREGIFIFEPPKEYEIKLKEKQKNIEYCHQRPKEIIYHCAPKRLETLPCNIHHCMVRGKPWIVFIGMHKGKPYEIFAGEYDKEIMHVPKKLKGGLIRQIKRKNRPTKYNLEIKIRNSKVVYEDIANLFMNEEYRTATRILSLTLRNGTYPEFIVQQIKKSNPELTDFYAVVARVLSKYINNYSLISNTSSNKCPNCGQETLVHEGGCIKCINEKCNYSRCE